MAIDTPARLAVLGAGPIGLEAALYARFLGYEVFIYERGEIAEAIRQAGDSPLTTPFKQNRTTLGLAALRAQDEAYRAPDDEAVLTCQEWRDRYLLPLAGTDLLSDHLRLNTTVTAIDFVPLDNGEDADTAFFHVRAHAPSGQQSIETFDGILDCTGRADNPRWTPGEEGGQYFHVLGSKTTADCNFAMIKGYEQIRAAFSVIGDRETLDLYASSARLPL